jgi:CDP-diglyceride synthetase
MTDHTDDEGTPVPEDTGGVDEDPPTYRSGQVRIIGAEPAGHAVLDPAESPSNDSFDMPHWNDAPTGQIPAVLDRGTGDEPTVAAPSWREEETDWAADEELFEPSMLSDDLPAVGSLVNDNNEQFDMERQPWHFEDEELPGDDDTLVIPSPLAEPEPSPAPQVQEAVTRPVRITDVEPLPEEGIRGIAPTPVSPEASTAAASRLRPPEPPLAEPRQPRSSRRKVTSTNGNSSNSTSTTTNGTNGNGNGSSGGGGTGGRDMRVAIGSGVALGVVALICFKLGNLPSLIVVLVVVILMAAEAFAAFRRAQYHPATLLGLVATVSLMVETYNKGVAALPLILIMLVAATFVWYLANVEPGADPVGGVTSTIFIFVWVGALGSFGALLLSPSLFPDRQGIAFLLAAIILTVACDVASLLVGSAWGRHPMAPLVSPNKTWEGFIGGAVASILVAVVVIHFIHPWTIGKALVLGVVVAIVAPLGDLSQSMIKRHLGVKDLGRIMPGHGGLLDRFDGLLFVLPATYFVVKAMHLG